MTRRYLSEVEEELAQTKALLQQVLSEGTQQDRQHRHPRSHSSEEPHDGPATMDGLCGGDVGTASPSNLVDRVQGRRVASVQGNEAMTDRHSDMNSLRQTQTSSGNISNTQISCLSGPADDEASPNRPILPVRRTSYRRQRESGLHSITASDLSLETPPSSGSFEWDERTGKANGDKFVDGMASLTSRSNEGGYLGIIAKYIKERRLLTKLRRGIWSCAASNGRFKVYRGSRYLRSRPAARARGLLSTPGVLCPNVPVSTGTFY